MSEVRIRVAVSRLLSAFASPEPSDDTAEIYVERLREHCRNMACLEASIDDLIDSGTKWLPRIAMILEQYHRNLPAFAPPALPMPALTDEEREDNLRKMKALSSHLAARGEDGHGETIEECEHPECKWATER